MITRVAQPEPSPPQPTPSSKEPIAEAVSDDGPPPVANANPVIARVDEPRPKPPKSPPRAIKRSSLEVRVLPEGTVEMDGAAPPATVASGPHTFTFSNRRFGTISKPVDVSACAGRIIVGYSFQSDKLTVSCRQ